ncbi:hypothetical protein QAD02_022404 [Eretmocerus hayati]|uniref:Uncharacterized protein n=1 Tax=Eretmocerus hayati TaxID=131215 RepID=A0ACC2PXT7_9HYME|nr:hypothetical protein QAD02_022404 [Eretmocerus hayati]
MGKSKSLRSLIATAFLVSIFLCCDGQRGSNPVVQISLGKIKGSLMTTRLGKTIYSFRGIRYAKSPTGQRRFRPAEPVDKWKGTYDASEDGPACPQQGGRDVTEDCLTLNVYTTKLPQGSSANTRRPVIVFFHPGALSGLSSQSRLFGPQYLLDQKIVLVTPNYRLASLGFISTGDSHAPGNLGFKDQVVALRFVRDHIAAFGGDPNSVTISGQSAGARCVYMHMLSPMSKGLFHRAIAHSGSPIFAEPTPHDQKNLAIKQAQFLNCPTDSMDKMFDCLRSKPSEAFGNSVGRFHEWHGDPILVWLPVVEPNIPGVERFLPAEPVDLIRSGNFNQVPLLTGVTQDEFGYVNIRAVEAAQKGDDSTFVELNRKWDQLAPISFLYQRGTARSRYISGQLLQFYFHGKPISLGNSIGRAHLYGDSITIFPVHKASSLIAASSRQPTYFFEFTYRGRYSFAHWSNGTAFGVVHGDDTIYLFYQSVFPKMFKPSDAEIPTLERMTSMWASFAKTGQPIPANNQLFASVRWDKLTASNKAYLEINKKLTLKSNLYGNRMAFWERVFPI